MSDCNAVVISRLGQLQELVQQIAEKLEITPKPRGKFADIDPEHLYSVPEMIELRGGSPQNIYRALRIGELQETVTNGQKRVLGRHWVAWLEAKGRRSR